ncbi:methyltransferase family protein [Crenobacter luteus]|uniref:Methyltransferase type 11 n=1 Tax=Crenobacter luteus TaxID=1452487 RepID=A0A163BAV4_9NEIS|nr:methyltransferase domain-containing protein [Crenobacter luteus]KZE25410.1 methyltransferase type 11 [Crenobacter luteus]TCP11100.1 methyltransferase family protein [Crenobacter luteus]
MMERFSEWLAESELGRYLLAREQAFFDRAVADAFGYHAVQIGLPAHDFLRANRIPMQLRADVEAPAGLLCLPEALPFAGNSLDLVVLPHTLDFTTHPHQVLREVERVLMPEGRLVLTGFNPWSLWGVKRVAAGRYEAPWNGQFLSLPRIRDWLELMEIEPDGGAFMAYAPPFAREDWLRRFAFMEGAGDRWWPLAAGVYGISAVKRTRGLRLITPQWGVAKKAARGLAVAAGNDRHRAARQAGGGGPQEPGSA